MLRSLCLTNFKGFQDEAFALGSFTLLIGTNAAGKSNLRDALMCLHAVGRGYAIPEALGERYEAGVRVWPGIRGGARGAARHGSSQFSLMTRTDFDGARALTHDLTLGVAAHGPASVTAETLWWIDDHVPLLETQPKSKAHELRCLVRADDRGNRIQLDFPASNSALTTLASPYGVARWGLAGRNLDEVNAVADEARRLMDAYARFRFLDLDPAAMRQPSTPGHTILSHRGENLSSVLQTLCADPARKASLLSWVRALTPMDADDLDFDTDLNDMVRLKLIEASGAQVSAASASDGTLRFLAMAAALLGADEGQLYFFEELDNGIHPTRLHLLLQLIQQATRENKVQVVATTHNPALLNFLDDDARKVAALVFRDEDEPTSHIVPIHQLPGIDEVLARRDLGYLHGTGWLEEAAQAWLDDKRAKEVAE